MADAQSIILHHYEASPYAEKVRMALRMKNLGWSSVDIPMIMPKPDVTALTGGYRKTPIMQIGADIFCDTSLILTELERRYKLPTLTLPGHEGLAEITASWAAVWFQCSVAIIFGTMADKIPQEFIEDRKAMNDGNLDVEALKRAAPLMQDQWRGHLNAVEQRLEGAQTTGSGDFMVGAKPGMVDVHAYFNVWWMARSLPSFMEACFEQAPLSKSWFERMQAHRGQEPEEISSADALDIAFSAAPRLKPASTSGEIRDLQPGQRVAIAPHDIGRDWVEGDLVIANTERVILARQDERAGNLHVHFPRVGYLLRQV